MCVLKAFFTGILKRTTNQPAILLPDKPRPFTYKFNYNGPDSNAGAVNLVGETGNNSENTAKSNTTKNKGGGV